MPEASGRTAKPVPAVFDAAACGGVRRLRWLALLLWPMLLAGGCATVPTAQPSAPTAAAADMVDIATLVPDIALDIRYATANNFTGARVDGYDTAKCFLLRPAAEGLREVELALRKEGMRLRIHDCYRPVRAVAQFVRWARDPSQATKADYYPNLDKSSLVPGYIADRSGHSKGATVDLTLLRCEDDAGPDCVELDMGTPFDFFDPRANTDHPELDPEQRRNRLLLRDHMQRAGFENYPMEWWHYTFRIEPAPDTFHDFPIR